MGSILGSPYLGNYHMEVSPKQLPEVFLAPWNLKGFATCRVVGYGKGGVVGNSTIYSSFERPLLGAKF